MCGLYCYSLLLICLYGYFKSWANKLRCLFVDMFPAIQGTLSRIWKLVDVIMLTLYVFSLCVIASPVIASLCPVLSSYGSEPQNLFHGYPVDLLLPSVFTEYPSAVFRNCSDRNKIWSNDVVTKCATDMRMCAVTRQNVQTALSIADWPQYAEAFLRINAAIQSKTQVPMNLFIIGGSMTRGSCTFSSCICNRITESTCPAIVGDVNVELVCAWPAMLEHWVTQKYPKIRVINLSQSGFTSTMMADNFADILRSKVGLTSLTSNDIVMIDHSVNDFADYSHSLQHGFESLLRRILHLATNHTRPTIVVIEQFPLGSPDQIIRHQDAALGRPGLQGSFDYAATYRAVSRHYGVILVSLREVFLTYDNFTSLNNVRTRMYPMPVSRDRHPPWWRHLFIADVLADTWLHIMSRLQQSTQSAPYITEAPALFTIPAPLYTSTHKNSAVCDTTKPYIVDVRPNATFTPRDVHAYETDIATVSKAGWREYIDYHNTPGFIINALSDPKQAVMSFPLQNRSTYQHLMLKIVYLKSYINMGVVQVHLCGDKLHLQHTIDALYHDHATYKFSLPTEFIYTITGGDNTRCLEMPANQRTLEILYLRTKDRFQTARGNQKVKIMSIDICVGAPLV